MRQSDPLPTATGTSRLQIKKERHTQPASFRTEILSRKKAQKAQKPSRLSGLFLRLLRIFAAIRIGRVLGAAQPRYAFVRPSGMVEI